MSLAKTGSTRCGQVCFASLHNAGCFLIWARVNRLLLLMKSLSCQSAAELSCVDAVKKCRSRNLSLSRKPALLLCAVFAVYLATVSTRRRWYLFNTPCCQTTASSSPTSSSFSSAACDDTDWTIKPNIKLFATTVRYRLFKTNIVQLLCNTDINRYQCTPSWN